jgi:DNA polymerase-3 subunit delta
MPAARSSPRSHVVLLHGEESFLIEEEARSRLKEWQAELVSDFGLDSLDASGVTAPRLRDAVLQGPFLDPYRVVVVRGIANRRTDGLAPALAEVPETTRLLLTIVGKLAPGSKLAKAVLGTGGIVKEYAPLRARAIQDWVAKRAREYGLPPLAAALTGRLGRQDLGVLDAELRKLAAYQAGGNRLDQKVIKELVVSDRPEDIFRLTDHLLPRPNGEAWRITSRLLERDSPTAIAYRLARHISLVLDVHVRQARGESLPEIQAAMREHPFVIQKAYGAARTISEDRLRADLRALLDYEWEVKSGQIDAELGLQVVLARL